MKFSELNIIDEIIKAVSEEGYSEPSKIQSEAIPSILEGNDLFGCAQTGTGKTAAFAIPILQRLKESRMSGIKALVVTPTRELALQIEESFVTYGKYLDLRTTAIYGGVNDRPQKKVLSRGVDVLIATPGRLLDLYNQKHLDFSHLEVLVLDEADRMLDMGFVHDVKKIVKIIPKERQTLLFSATLPNSIKSLLPLVLKENYKRVSVTPVSSTVDRIQQSLYYVDNSNKPSLLVDLVKGKDRVLVFTRTKVRANRVAKRLNQEHIKASAIHGDKSQTARMFALQNFKENKIQVLVATDIAARGIDIEELRHVINFDLPNIEETYVHRIGRSGRAGNEGEAISLVAYDEIEDLKKIEKVIKKKITELESPYPMVDLVKKEKNQPKPRRKSKPKTEGKKPSTFKEESKPKKKKVTTEESSTVIYKNKVVKNKDFKDGKKDQGRNHRQSRKRAS